MRVLFSCRPGVGHFHPIAPLASALMAAGHAVQFVCSPDTQEAIQRAGFAVTAVGLTDQESIERRARAMPELRNVPRHRLRPLVFSRAFADIELEARLPGMLEAAREYRRKKEDRWFSVGAGLRPALPVEGHRGAKWPLGCQGVVSDHPLQGKNSRVTLDD